MPRNDEPVPYMERTREYYRGLGYTKDYVWANFADVPFTRLAKPLREARIGLVTSAHPPDKSNHDAAGIRHVWSGQTDPLPSLNTDNLSWDRESTHTEDRESFIFTNSGPRRDISVIVRDAAPGLRKEKGAYHETSRGQARIDSLIRQSDRLLGCGANSEV